MRKIVLYINLASFIGLFPFYSCANQPNENSDAKSIKLQTNEEQKNQKFSFTALDSNRVEQFHGNFILVINQNVVSGTWKIFSGDSGILNGTITDSTINLKFNPNFVDNNMLIEAVIENDSIKGKWTEVGFYGVLKSGLFCGEKVK